MTQYLQEKLAQSIKEFQQYAAERKPKLRVLFEERNKRIVLFSDDVGWALLLGHDGYYSYIANPDGAIDPETNRSKYTLDGNDLVFLEENGQEAGRFTFPFVRDAINRAIEMSRMMSLESADFSPDYFVGEDGNRRLESAALGSNLQKGFLGLMAERHTRLS